MKQAVIARTASDWQTLLQQSIRDAASLAAALGLNAEELALSERAAQQFPVLVPPPFLERMIPGDAADPLLRQVLAVRAEEHTAEGFHEDPVGELTQYADQPGLIMKYHGRALLIVTGQCAVNCRYCFRRHYPYADNRLASRERHAQLEALLADPSLKEILLSGGDPLLLPDAQLQRIVAQIRDARADVILRIHTRLPIVIPQRVTPALRELLRLGGGKTVVVVHSNHPREIDTDTAQALRALADDGNTMLNQSVLLRGINDDPDTLAALSDRLFAAGTLPYYLHLLDPVAGASHFDVPSEEAQRIVARLAALQPGYLVPRLVREVTGGASKHVIAPRYDSLAGHRNSP